jgi:hypothetical protein
MKKITSIAKFLVAIFILTTINNACTKLDPDYGSSINTEEYLKIKIDPDKALQSVYGSLASGSFAGGHNSYWSDQETSTDELMIPQRGGDWFDGGQWLRMHRHEYTANEESFRNTWNAAYSAIAASNRLLVQIQVQDTAQGKPIFTKVEPELRAARAMYYYFLLDLFGNVPKIVSYPGNLAEAATVPRAEIYAFVRDEFNYAASKLTRSKTYGRLNYYAVQGFLAKLYLNAEAYTGTAQYAAANTAATEVLSGPYALESDYYNNFKADNEGSTENVFVVPYDEVSLQGFNLAQMTLHYESQKTFNLAAQPWNGYCSLADFYNSYDNADKRKANLLAGQQFASDGVTKLVDNGKDLVFDANINEHFPNAARGAGARVAKFKYKLGATPNLSNDFPLVRLGEMILIKAECALRPGGAGAAAALTEVNKMRPRTGLANYTAITLDELYKERGREMFAEGTRRSDMIRFGTYFKPYDKWKTSTDPAEKAIMPIPKTQLDANIKLKQNPGYIK